MLRDRWTAKSRHSLLWMGLIVGAVGMLLAVGGCGGSDEDAESPDSTASEVLTPTPANAFTLLDLPDLVLQRSDVPLELELVEIEQDSELEYKVEYELPDPVASSTGLLSIENVARLENVPVPSLSGVTSLQRHVIDAVEIPSVRNLVDESILYRVTVQAGLADHHVYYGFINHGDLGATLIAVQGTVPAASPEEVEATVSAILLLMQAQADLLLQ